MVKEKLVRKIDCQKLHVATILPSQWYGNNIIREW